MMEKRNRFDMWTGVTLIFLLLFLLILVYPLFEILRQSVRGENGRLTLSQFVRFFSQPYYSKTILNSFKVSVSITLVTLLIGIPISYFYSFYKLKGAKFLFIVSILCCMSAPFIGAYSWILLLGRSGVITQFFEKVLGIKIGNIYGFGGILLVQSLKLFPLVFIYMNGAFKNIDNTLLKHQQTLVVLE
jgi:iron(III) transport system permease protein